MAERWQLNFYAIFVAEILAVAGFGSASPIIPFYVQHLGVSEPGKVKMWVGIIQTSGSAMVALFSPIWGRLADSYGRRLMFLRALIGGSIMMALIGIASHPWQLVVFRGFGGIFTGTVAAATVLVATTVPKDKRGYCLGMLQSGVLIGSAVGPVIGGTVADFFGYRAAFFVTSGLLAGGAGVVFLFVRENFTRTPSSERFLRRIVPDFGVLRASPELVALIAVVGTVHLSSSVLLPMLPLFIQSLAKGGVMIGSITGLVIGMRAFSGAFAAATIGRISDKVGYRRVLLICMLAGMAAHVPLIFVTNYWQLLVLRIIGGFFLGGTIPSLNALIAIKAESGQQGAVYGLSASFGSAGGAIGPALGAVVAAAWGFDAVFLLTAAVLGISALIVATRVARPTSS